MTRKLLHDVFAEVLEDIALAEAIREGQRTERVAREEIFRSKPTGEDRILQEF